jgi:hypothetical protein
VYLAKSEQYLMLKSADRIRTFDMGQVPKKSSSGRPRVDSEASGTSTELIEPSSHGVTDANTGKLDKDQNE